MLRIMTSINLRKRLKIIFKQTDDNIFMSKEFRSEKLPRQCVFNACVSLLCIKICEKSISLRLFPTPRAKALPNNKIELFFFPNNKTKRNFFPSNKMGLSVFQNNKIGLFLNNKLIFFSTRLTFEPYWSDKISHLG